MKKLTFPFLATVFIYSVFAETKPELKKIDQVILLDVQGLWGGQDLWVSATDGKAFSRLATPPGKEESGLQETRYEFTLSKEQQLSLLEIIRNHSFFSIRTENRYGVPDEARSEIFVKSGDNIHAAGKWANDAHKEFDAIYAFLLTIIESGKNGKEIHRGAFDWNWRPEGFPESKIIWKMTQPQIKEE